MGWPDHHAREHVVFCWVWDCVGDTGDGQEQLENECCVQHLVTWITGLEDVDILRLLDVRSLELGYISKVGSNIKMAGANGCNGST